MNEFVENVKVVKEFTSQLNKRVCLFGRISVMYIVFHRNEGGLISTKIQFYFSKIYPAISCFSYSKYFNVETNYVSLH